jgi:hypothetical protein
MPNPYQNLLPDELQRLVDEFTAEFLDMGSAFEQSFQGMINESNELNKTFVQGRERIVEMNAAIADTVPVLTRLGGSVADTGKIFREVSEATRRNVIASTEDISKLFSVSKLLDNQNLGNLIGRFQDIGVQFSRVGPQIENSINYVRSVGANAKTVMSDVVDYLDEMNKYDFRDGVDGLTRMATQASLLRIDMNTTFRLAEDALNPERAIELSSAFQRLGVNVGELTDPFMLMNKSLTDPEGLQDSLINMTKQFTVFDEQTKSFKINPQGMLMIREISKQTNISADELRKMSLNAADLDKKLSNISPSIKFANEEDKMYLANISKMNEKGEYTVNFKGTDIKIKELQQPQLDQLIEEQKKGPKTLEDLTRDQLGVSELLRGDVMSIRDKIVYGITGAEVVRRELEGMRNLSDAVVGTVSGRVGKIDVRGEVDDLIDKIGNLAVSFTRGDEGAKEREKIFGDTLKKLGGYYEELNQNQKGVLSEILGKVDKKTFVGKTATDWLLKPIQEKLDKTESNSRTPINSNSVVSTQNINARNLTVSEINTKSTSLEKSFSNASSTKSINQTVKIEGGGEVIIKHKIEAPPGVNAEYIEKLLNSQKFAEDIQKNVIDKLVNMGIIENKPK